MTQARTQARESLAELVTLRKRAQEMAASRKERMTSVHLLAAVAASDGAAGALLRERRLDAEALLKASRAFDDDGPDPIGRIFTAARQVAMRRLWYGAEPEPPPASAGRAAHARPSAPRSSSPEPTALHLLLAVLGDRNAAAHRSLVQAGVDLARLRTAAMQIALGVVATRRRTDAGGGNARPAAETEARRIAAAPAQATPATPASSLPVSPRARTSTLPPASGPGVAVPILPAAPAVPRRVAPPAAAALAPALPASQASPGMLAPVGASRFALDRGRFPALSAAGNNLTQAAAEGRLDEVVGRDVEVDRVLDVLARRHANSPCLVGPPGVGKTAVARGLAHRLVELDGQGDAPPRVLVELSVAELLAAGRRSLAERLAAIRAELADAGGRVILFVDEAHELFAPGYLDDAAAEVKLGLARGEVRLVSATTTEEYRRSVELDSALARRVTPVEIEEPDEAAAFLLLRTVAAGLGRHHDVAYGDEVLAATVSWSIRYLPGRALPDKAIAVLDLAGARAHRKAVEEPGRSAPGRRRDGGRSAAREVALADVAAVVAEVADVPVERLLETDRDRLLGLENVLAERVVGHGAALARIARVVRRNAAGLRGRRPIGSFLLLGPTGVGKTETAKALAEALFHSPDAMTRLDFSEYSEAHAVARLIGAPPGYVGHEAGGQLTEAVRRRPYQVVLLDEIEKAHRDVLEAFLQVFDEGRLTDGRGRRVDFTNAVIVMTSNLGAAELAAKSDARGVGFTAAAAPRAVAPERLAETMIAAARAYLPPELYNRIDEVLCFGPLARAEVAEIARRLLAGLEQNLASRGIRLDVEPGVLDVLLAAGGFDASLGARPMKRTIGRLVENPLAELILRGDLDAGGVALVGVDGGEIVVDALPADEGQEEAESAAAG